MQILPTIQATRQDNGGIVPPWLETRPAGRGRNPGIVPPWLQAPGGIVPVAPTEPVGPDVPRILAITATTFDPIPVTTEIGTEIPRILPIG